MDRRERVANLDESFLAVQDGVQSRIWTALPAIVQSYDPIENTIVAQPSVQGQFRDTDGNWTNVNLPLLLDVPVHFAGGGRYTLTFPLALNDEVLVIFASRCIDAWWKYGGIQVQTALRMHSLSDGFAIPVVFSVPRVPENISTNSAVLRSNDGAISIEITDSNVMNLVAPGGLNIIGDVNVTGTVMASGEGTFNGGHTVSAHHHGGVVAGGANTSGPTG